MPYRINKIGKSYEVINATTQQVVTTSATKQEAQKNINALYEKENPRKKKPRPSKCHKEL